MDLLKVAIDNLLERNLAPVTKPKLQLQKTFLREWRRARNISQEAAARELNITRSLLSQLENAKSPYTQRLIERAAALYGCSPAEILAGPTATVNVEMLYRTIVVIEQSRPEIDLHEKARTVATLYHFMTADHQLLFNPEIAEQFLRRALDEQQPS